MERLGCGDVLTEENTSIELASLGVNPDFLPGKTEERPSVLHLSSTFPDWECDRKMTESFIFQRISNTFSDERLFNQLVGGR